jgi:hypothetical protein
MLFLTLILTLLCQSQSIINQSDLQRLGVNGQVAEIQVYKLESPVEKKHTRMLPTKRELNERNLYNRQGNLTEHQEFTEGKMYALREHRLESEIHIEIEHRSPDSVFGSSRSEDGKIEPPKRDSRGWLLETAISRRVADNQGRVSEETVIQSDPSFLTVGRRMVYVYDERGRMVVKLAFFQGDKEAQIKTISSFNEKGELFREEFFYGGKLNRVSSFSVYQVDKSGNWISRSVVMESGAKKTKSHYREIRQIRYYR